MFSRRQFLTALGLLSVTGCRSLVGGKSATDYQPLPTPRPGLTPARPCCWVEDIRPTSIAIVGDIQRTGLLEQTVLGRRQNDKEREAVLKAIAGERPDMILMLGDQVVLGDDDDGWSYFDRIMAPIHEAGIPVRAMLGNHDYEGSLHSRCISNFCDRFPHQRETMHGLIRLGAVALLTLDSNFDRLTREEIAAQSRQYETWLDKLDDDPQIRGVIVASHHPPYTNSDLAGNARLAMVEQMFARPFLNARKTRLYLSGHVHSYERFIIGDKMFVTSGGGGGPQREVDISSRRPYKNDAYRKEILRPFHYIMLTLKEDKMTAEVKMLRKKSSSDWRFAAGDRFPLGLYG